MMMLRLFHPTPNGWDAWSGLGWFNDSSQFDWWMISRALRRAMKNPIPNHRDRKGRFV